MKATRIPACVLPTALLIAAAAGHASDVRFQTVALSGDPAPGLGPVVFDWFSDPRLAVTQGVGEPIARIGFWADLAGPGVSENTNGSIWSNRTGPLALVAREGDPSPIPNLVWGAFPSPGASGSIDQFFAFTASLFDPAQPNLPTNLGMFRQMAPGGGFELIAREGDPAPGAGLPPGTTFANLPIALFRPFSANNGLGIWWGTPGMVNLLVRSGQLAPGVTGSYFGHLSNPVSLATGTLSFSATLFSTPLPQIGQPTGSGIWVSSPIPSANLVAVTGGPAFGTGSSIKYKELSAQPQTVSLGGTTHTTYWASLVDGGVTPNNDAGLFVQPFGPAGPRVREGDPAAGVGPGIFFSSFSRQVRIGGTMPGGVWGLAFRATITGDGVSNLNNSGIWITPVTTVPFPPSLVAREGDQVPRLPEGTFYASFSDPVVNDAGQVVFLARLRGPAVTQETSQVLMAKERPDLVPNFGAGSVAPLVRTGDLFDVGGGDLRKVNEIIFDSGPAGSGAEAFAWNGMLVFKLGFRDPIVPPPPPPQLAFAFTQGLFSATIRCLADINADGALTVADFIAFQGAYVLGDLRTCDFSENGVLSVADFSAFQSAFVSGCP